MPSPRTLAFVLSAAALSSACRSDLPDPAAQLRGIIMGHALTREDSVTLARYGPVIATVRVDSAMVILTAANDAQLHQVPGVLGVGVPQGQSGAGLIETCIVVTPPSLARATTIAASIGEVELPQNPRSTEVCAMVPADHLSQLNNFDDLAGVYLNFDPAEPVSP
jgi:hypothetical protein